MKSGRHPSICVISQKEHLKASSTPFRCNVENMRTQIRMKESWSLMMIFGQQTHNTRSNSVFFSSSTAITASIATNSRTMGHDRHGSYVQNQRRSFYIVIFQHFQQQPHQQNSTKRVLVWWMYPENYEWLARENIEHFVRTKRQSNGKPAATHTHRLTMEMQMCKSLVLNDERGYCCQVATRSLTDALKETKTHAVPLPLHLGYTMNR